MTKATNNGTCQVCGNQQAVNGTLALHGYTVDYGYFAGTCAGARELPLEVSRTIADDTIAALRAEADRREALTIDDIKEVNVVTYERGQRRETVCRDQYEVDMTGKRESFRRLAEAKLWNLHNSVKHLRTAAADLEALANARHGQPLIDRAEQAETIKREKAEKANRVTKAQVKREHDKLNREYETIRREAMTEMLRRRNEEGQELSEGYDALPFSLHHYRPAKHAGFIAEFVSAEAAERIVKLTEERAAWKAALAA